MTAHYIYKSGGNGSLQKDENFPKMVWSPLLSGRLKQAIRFVTLGEFSCTVKNIFSLRFNILIKTVDIFVQVKLADKN